VKSFIDTNVLIYWVDNSSRADVVEHLLTQQAVISVQVLNEFANVLRRMRAMSLPDVEILCATLIDTCDVVDVSVRTHQTALTLMARYNMSVYDANIVAAAVMSNCAILYTEDMQDGLNVKAPASDRANALVIRNPFI